MNNYFCLFKWLKTNLKGWKRGAESIPSEDAAERF